MSTIFIHFQNIAPLRHNPPLSLLRVSIRISASILPIPIMSALVFAHLTLRQACLKVHAIFRRRRRAMRFAVAVPTLTPSASGAYFRIEGEYDESVQIPYRCRDNRHYSRCRVGVQLCAGRARSDCAPSACRRARARTGARRARAYAAGGACSAGAGRARSAGVPISGAARPGAAYRAAHASRRSQRPGAARRYERGRFQARRSSHLGRRPARIPAEMGYDASRRLALHRTLQPPLQRHPAVQPAQRHRCAARLGGKLGVRRRRGRNNAQPC